MEPIDSLDHVDDNPVLWPRALKWLLLLGPLFFISYGAVNELTAVRDDVGQFVFAWEHHIPFWDWTIVPYMSIDLLYAVSLFLCANKSELDRHGLRLLLATLISVGCFLLFPLQFTFVRPETSGLYGGLFDLLTSFDKPYNQAPSLHISLLVLIWGVFHQHTRGAPARLLMHCWMFLIGLSVLTTWQHHFIDVLGGLAVALLLLYLIPTLPLRWRWSRHQDSASQRLSRAYGGGSILLGSTALMLGGWGWLLLWPATATMLVALAYAGAGTAIFQHSARGMSIPALILLAPYLAAARLSAGWLSRKRPPCVQVAEGIWLGRVPVAADIRSSQAARVLNVTAEMRPLCRQGAGERRVPMLDLLAPQPAQLALAVTQLEVMARSGQPVLVHCALGLSRSALVVAGWLLHSGQTRSVDQAIDRVCLARPGCVIGAAQKSALLALAAELPLAPPALPTGGADHQTASPPPTQLATATGERIDG